MAKLKLDTKRSFDGDLFVFGDHVTKEEAEKICLEQGDIEEYEMVKEVNHDYATYGMVPEHIREEEGQHGWWIIDSPKEYKRKKKVTEVIVIKKAGVPTVCPKCNTKRVWLHGTLGEASCNYCNHNWNYTIEKTEVK